MKNYDDPIPYATTLVPMVVEQTNRGERAYDIYSRLLKDGYLRVHQFPGRLDHRGHGDL